MKGERSKKIVNGKLFLQSKHVSNDILLHNVLLKANYCKWNQL